MLTELKVGQLIRGTKEADEHFNVTDSRMALGEVVESDAKPFDLVKVLEHEDSFEVGEEYAVMKINGSYPFELVEKEETAKDELAEFLEALLGISKMVGEKTEAEEPAVKFTKGDKVKLVSGGDSFPLRGFSNGETYRVEDPAFDHPDGEKIKIVGVGTGLVGAGGGYADPEQLELVGAEIKVGDLVEIIDNSITPYDVGDRGTVISIDKLAEIFTYVVDFGGNEQWLMGKHIKVVLEAKPEPKRDLQKGDKVRLLKAEHTTNGFEVGNVYTVQDPDWNTRLKRVNIVDSKGLDGYCFASNLELVTDTEEPTPELKVGDKVKFTEHNRYTNDYKVGETYEIVRLGTPYDTVEITGGGQPSAYPFIKDVVLVEEEPLKVGDKVKIIRGGGTDCLHGFENGSIYKVTSTTTGGRKPVRVETAKGHVGFAGPEQLEKVADTTPLSGAQVERELKVGDVVEFTRDGDYFTDFQNNGVITDIDAYDSYTPYLVFVDGVTVWAEPSDIKLAK